METLPTVKEALGKLQAWGSDQRLNVYTNSATLYLGGVYVRCEVYVEYESSRLSEVTEDEEGNVWKDYVLTVKMNWPAFGSVHLDVASEFIRILESARSSALIISSLLPPVCRECVLTKAEKDQRAQDNLKHVFLTFVSDKGWTKNMRKGGVKTCYLTPEESEKFSNIPSMYVPIKNKTFQLTVVNQTVRIVSCE